MARILLADDSETILLLLRTRLEMEGHEVETATDGMQAIDAAKRFLPHVILLDIGLPRLNGYETARALRELAPLRDTLLVACTGYGSADDRQRALSAGFDRHVVKPVTAETLTAILVDAVARVREERKRLS